MPRSLFLLLALFPGCGLPPPAGLVAPSPSSRPATPSAPELPPDVLARARGKQGLIQVELREGRRVLTINGVVQGASRPASPLETTDPLVALVRHLRPGARTALLIGLGTGATAGDLSRVGLQVQAVELEPEVIAFARRYFGYQGRAVAADGLAFVKRTREKYDVIVVDAFSGTEALPAPYDWEAIRVLSRPLVAGGLIVHRLLGKPDDPRIRKLVGGEQVSYRALFGSGVGNEVQNLYLLTADMLLIPDTGNLPLWPVAFPWVEDRIRARPAKEPGARSVDLVGYLITVSASGELALDLFHREMGALRFLLLGEKAEELRRYLPRGKHALFPTRGEIRSDGDVTKTAGWLLGADGCKRSDLRYSPVVVHLSGTARLRAAAHPDVVFVPRRAERDPRLPHGGALYELTVTEVHSVLTAKTLEPLKRRLDRRSGRAAQALARGDLPAAEKALAVAVEEIEKTAGSLAPRTSEHSHLSRLLAAVREQRAWVEERLASLDAVDAETRWFATALGCDRAREDKYEYYLSHTNRLLESLKACAVRGYERTARTPGHLLARKAAERLIYFYWVPEDRRTAALRRRFKGPLKELDHPPSW